MREGGVKNIERASLAVVVALLLVSCGLGYAHIRGEGLFWTLSLIASSLWRLVAAHFDAAGVHARAWLLSLTLLAFGLLLSVERLPKMRRRSTHSTAAGRNRE